MAKHNKWSKVKHRKAAVEKKRGKIWNKVAKAIIVAAKNGGGDPTMNLTLRYAIDEARYANMPRDTIERAIQRGAGGGDTSNYEQARYEGYAPGGVAIIIDALTDNRTRTAADVRLCFSDAGTSLATTGAVSYMFAPRGQIVVTGATEDRVMEVALEAGALDVQNMNEGSDDADEPPMFAVLCEVGMFAVVKEAIENAKLKVEEAGLTMIPENYVSVDGEAADTLHELVEALEDLDDVQKVYTNAQ